MSYNLDFSYKRIIESLQFKCILYETFHYSSVYARDNVITIFCLFIYSCIEMYTLLYDNGRSFDLNCIKKLLACLLKIPVFQ